MEPGGVRARGPCHGEETLSRRGGGLFLLIANFLRFCPRVSPRALLPSSERVHVTAAPFWSHVGSPRLSRIGDSRLTLSHRCSVWSLSLAPRVTDEAS